ncbi:hypothetical protein FRB90_009274 [Tulasnella sp. 427]|nr:hypothetical protein FRB90_009274 [Tulasnella sp. 427]
MGNVLVNGQLRAVLADFGLSEILEDEATGLTTSDGLKGTVRYYSPELVLEPDAKHSLQSDIWAWACVTLTDTVPYADKKSDPALWLALAKEEMPADLESFSSFHPDLSRWLSNCWQTRPSDRPSVSVCLRALNALAPPQDEVADRIVTELECHSSAPNDFIGQASPPLPPPASQDIVEQAYELEDEDLDEDSAPETVLWLKFAPCADWFLRNLGCPYPSRPEKISLSLHTKLSIHTINLWFTNTRRRSGWLTIMQKYGHNRKENMRRLLEADPHHLTSQELRDAITQMRKYVTDLSSSAAVDAKRAMAKADYCSTDDSEYFSAPETFENQMTSDAIEDD